jgi:hypothetical protein
MPTPNEFNDASPITVEDLARFKADLIREMHQLFGGRERGGGLPARSGTVSRQYEALTARDSTEENREAIIAEFAKAIKEARNV